MGVRPLTSSVDLVEHLGELGPHTARELRLVLPRRPYDRRVRERAVALSAQLVRRGVRVRALHLTEARPEPAYTADTLRLAASGVQLRAVPYLPTGMVLIDRELAIVSASGARAPGAASVLLRGAGLVASYHALFEQMWARGTGRTTRPDRYEPTPTAPAGPAEPAEPAELNERERETLVLLAEGLTDDGISRRTGLSVRTSRRTIAHLMDRLGARSRFQAGVEAARRHWI
ncbi:LuxR C-terminal-related transcriptional regulator [Streptomyces sp. NPDC086554]|uniref:helix-turn-helix transcriptional regulator n=1 Tax=Streptomyces sp. NPDC086554 TaxID=3154864 RepID=UPI003439DCFF